MPEHVPHGLIGTKRDEMCRCSGQRLHRIFGSAGTRGELSRNCATKEMTRNADQAAVASSLWFCRDSWGIAGFFVVRTIAAASDQSDFRRMNRGWR